MVFPYPDQEKTLSWYNFGVTMVWPNLMLWTKREWRGQEHLGGLEDLGAAVDTKAERRDGGISRQVQAIDAFLAASKEEYHKRPDQLERQDRDAARGTRQRREAQEEVPLVAKPAKTGWHHTDVARPQFHGEIRPGLFRQTSTA